MKRLIALGVAVIVLAGATSATAGPLPVLGPQAYPNRYQLGFGHVEPRIIFMGGDPSGIVCRIRWITWGQEFAIGTGVALDTIGPHGNQGVSRGHWAPAVVVLSHLGHSRGRRAYLRYGWTFPDGENIKSRGCRTTGTAGTAGTAAASPSSKAAVNAASATTFFRQQVANQFNGPIALGDGRGCARTRPNHFTCTAYVRNPSRDIDVFGTVVASEGNMTVDAHLAHGDEIQSWFTRTGGGCKTNAC